MSRIRWWGLEETLFERVDGLATSFLYQSSSYSTLTTAYSAGNTH